MGTSSGDPSHGVSADGLGNIYISGFTYGDMGGANAGGADGFLSKYNASGTLLWTEQLGSSGDDLSWDVTADSLGNVYISGTTEGSLGGTNAGGRDAFLSKYDASGTLLWTEQLGTGGFDDSRGVSADSLGNAYISGATEGNLGGANAGSRDAFLSKYDASGTLLWTEQLGTNRADHGFGVFADGLGNVYISGATEGSLGGDNAGGADAFVSKYNASGTFLWTEQLGTSSDDQIRGVSTGDFGNVYISGITRGSLGGVNAGSNDAFIAKIITSNLTGDYNGDGTVDAADYTVWRDSEGTTGTGLAADPNNDGVVNSVDYDLWKSNYGATALSASVPEPTSALLTGILLMAWGCNRRSS